MDSIGWTAGQEILACVCGCRCSVAGGGEGFVDGDLDAGEFCVGHAGEVEEVEGVVY